MNMTIESNETARGINTRPENAATEFPPVGSIDNPAMSNSASDDGVRLSRRAPSASPADQAANAFPRGRWTPTITTGLRKLPPLTGLLEAPLHTLFWSPPETSMVEEATQRIAALLQAAADAVQEIQLFDDVYEVPAC